MNKFKSELIFTLGILFLPIFILAPALFSESHAAIIASIRTGAGPFYASAPSDLAQDIVGFRAMAQREDPYPVLSTAAEKYGLWFPVDAKSTHPPTTFLFVSPIAFLSWQSASRIWALFTLMGIICTFRLFGFNWPRAVGYGCLSLLWLPLMQSLAQFTVLWLLLITIAYQVRNRYPFLSGFCIGIATLLKFLPAILLIPFLLARKWQALYGFLLAGLSGGVAVLMISPQAIFQYIETQRNAQSIVSRMDNASLFNVGKHLLGTPGFLLAVLLVGLFMYYNFRHLRAGDSEISDTSWAVWNYLSVILLPVVWVYSLVPLLPTLNAFLQSRVKGLQGIGVLILLLPLWGQAWGDRSVPWIVLVTLFFGVGVTIQNSTFPSILEPNAHID